MTIASALNQHPLALLGEALDDAQGGNGSAFVMKMTSALLDQVFAHDPHAIHLSDGRSILVCAYKAHPSLGMQWWKLRGPHAWQPTPSTPYPLIELLAKTTSRSWAQDDFQRIDTRVEGARAARQFFKDGLAHAMPLGHEQARQWDPAQRLSAAQKDRLRQQCRLVEYCLNQQGAKDLPARHKLHDLAKADGVLPMEVMTHSRAHTFLTAYPDGAAMSVFNASQFGKKQATPWLAWSEHWVTLSNFQAADTVINALKRAGKDIEPIETMSFVALAMEHIRRGRNHKTPLAQDWQWLRGQMDARSDGWSVENGAGILWQQAIGTRPDLLGPALSCPTVPWEQRDTQDQGAWDHLTTHVLQGHIPFATFKRLLAKVDPILAPSTTPLFWDYWKPDTHQYKPFLDATINAHPGLWLGSAKQQRVGACRLLERWLSGVGSEFLAAGANINALFDPAIDRKWLSNDLKTIMHIFQRVAGDHAFHSNASPNAITHPLAEDMEHNDKLLQYIDSKFCTDTTNNPMMLSAHRAMLEMTTPTAASRPRARF